MNGLKATERLKGELPEIQVIILSQYNLQEYREAAKARGAGAYVVKKAMTDKLLLAIRQVTNNQDKAHEQ